LPFASYTILPNMSENCHVQSSFRRSDGRHHGAPPVNTVHGFEYGMDSDGWVLTVAEPYLRNLLDRMPELRVVWSEPRILSLAVDDEETSDTRSALLRLDRELDESPSKYRDRKRLSPGDASRSAPGVS
jgi:hypothetical protein